jgi:uncharacterized protein YecT (DUF1311 family)
MNGPDHILHSIAVQINNAYNILVINWGIAAMAKFGFFVAAAMLLTHTAVTAKTPAHDGYVHFAPTKAEIAQMPNAEDLACLTKADQEPFAVIECTAPQFDRVEQRLNVSYRAVMARLPKTQKIKLRSEQRLWLITREATCKARVGDELNDTSITYHEAMTQCALAELYRRTLWVERYR